MTANAVIDRGGGHIDHSFGEYGISYGVGYYPWGDSRFSTDGEISQVKARLISKLIDKIQSHRVNLGEVLQTRNQTASMVVSTANRLVGTIRSLKRGNFVGAARYLTGADPRTGPQVRISKSGRVMSGLGGIPEQWLALQYGWKPLLQDVYNSCETVHRAWNDNGDLFTADASASATPERISFVRDRAAPWGPRFRIETTQRAVRGNASVTYGVDSNIGSSLSQLGITNPASLAWELLPYSFVVDWFLPIGPYLERLDYSQGLVFKHGWVTVHSRQGVKQRLEDSVVEYQGFHTLMCSGAEGSGEAFVMVRDALGSFPPVPPPRLKDPFSPTHVANALSLLATAFRGGKTPR